MFMMLYKWKISRDGLHYNVQQSNDIHTYIYMLIQARASIWGSLYYT